MSLIEETDGFTEIGAFKSVIFSVWPKSTSLCCHRKQFAVITFFMELNSTRNKPVQVIVPSAKTQVDTAQKCDRLVNNYTLFVMGPQKNARRHVMRMSEHFDVGIVAILSQYFFNS